MNMLFDFSSALLQARQRKGVTQEQIAFSLNISQATYNAWECGHRLCPYKHIVALISYFDDEQFTRRMLRILLSLQHNMAGLNSKTATELNTYYMKLIALLADECAEWLRTLQRPTR
jgi:transcriptional regulator with XRE-family HTH domain